MSVFLSVELAVDDDDQRTFDFKMKFARVVYPFVLNSK